VRGAQIGRHGVGIVEVGDGRREIRLARQQNVFGAAGQVGYVFLGQRGDRESVSAERVGIHESQFQTPADRANPSDVQPRLGSVVKNC
jgi:hypothetical protein